MLVHNEEKKMLIESMKKLVGHVAGNHQRQQDIFSAFTNNDFNKIISNLKDDNQYLRRISALFLCQLFYCNSTTKAGVVRLLSLQPEQGRICLSGIPEMAIKYPSTIKKCVELMHGHISQEQENKICWVINLERKHLKMEFLQYKRYSSFTFIDPAKHIFGFTLINHNNKSPGRTPKSPKITSLRQSLDPKVEARHLNSSMDTYERLLEERQRSKERVPYQKYSLHLNSELKSERKSTSFHGDTSYKNQLGTPKYDKRPQVIKTSEIRVGTTNDYVRSKKQATNRTYVPLLQVSPKISFTQGIGSARSKNSSYQQQLATDRSTNSRKYSQVTGPASTRENRTKEQDKYYKRVKDIIRK